MDKSYDDFVKRMGSFDDTIEIPSNPELKHFGILGMKWGHHKNYVNAGWSSSDGSSHKPFKVNAGMVGAAAKTGQNVSKLGQDINRGQFNNKVLKEAKKMTDEDLKKLTNRLNLENNYINAKNQQEGRSKVDAILSTTGSALAVATSAAVLYDIIKKARAVT